MALIYILGAERLKMKICKLFLLTGMACLFSHSAYAVKWLAGDKYSVAGENTAGLCQLVNGNPCQEKEDAKSSNDTPLKKIIAGEVDLAAIPATNIKSDMPLFVLMNLSSDKSTVLVSRRNFPEKDGLYIFTAIGDFLSSNHKMKDSGLPQGLMNMARAYGEEDILFPYLILDREYPLHPGIVKNYLSKLEAPLTIAYITDLPSEDFRDSQKIAQMGMGVAPYLEEAMKSNNDFLVMKAASALGLIWPQNSKPLTPPLLDLLTHPNEEVREQAIASLSRLRPVQPETIARLIELADKEPVEREDFSDGSRGIGGAVSVIKQESVSQLAANALTNLSPDAAIPVLKKLVSSQNPAKQAVGINAIGVYLFAMEREVAEKLPPGERKDITITDFPEQTQDVMTFLEKKQNELPDENKHLAFSVLIRYKPAAIPQETIRALANDLLSQDKDCQKTLGDKEICEFPKMRDALYKLKAAGHDAAIPEVLPGIENVLKNGERREREAAYRLLSDLASEIDFPDSLMNTMLEQANAVSEDTSFEALALAIERLPNWRERIAAYFEKQLRNENGWIRSAAVKGLALAAKSLPEKQKEISQKLGSGLIN